MQTGWLRILSRSGHILHRKMLKTFNIMHISVSIFLSLTLIWCSIVNSYVVPISLHTDGIPKIVGVIGVAFGTHRAPIIHLNQALQFLEAQIRVQIYILRVWVEVFARSLLSERVYKEIENVEWQLEMHFSECCYQISYLDETALLFVSLDETLFQRLNVLQLDVERPYAFLDLKLLALVEFVFADAVDYVLGLHVPIDVYGCGATRHFDGVEIPYRMLVFTHKCMVFGVLPCLYVNIVADVVFLLFVVHDHSI